MSGKALPPSFPFLRLLMVLQTMPYSEYASTGACYAIIIDLKTAYDKIYGRHNQQTKRILHVGDKALTKVAIWTSLRQTDRRLIVFFFHAIFEG